jgi:hypothetical protein
LGLLIEARGQWVPLYEILDLGIAQYNARLFELRRAGFAVENRKERRDGKLLSFFRLSPAVAQRAVSKQREQTKSAAGPVSLFGDLSPTHKDLG